MQLLVPDLFDPALAGETTNRNPAQSGKVQEWFNWRSWKDRVPEMVPWVRIPPFPLCAGESVCARKSIRGSNPTPSVANEVSKEGERANCFARVGMRRVWRCAAGTAKPRPEGESHSFRHRQESNE